MNGQLTASNATLGLSDSEELANRVTHGLGLVLSIGGALIMAAVLGLGDEWRAAGCSVYMACLIVLYAMSTLSHTFQSPRLRSLFRSLDQGSIYLLIAATYTPFSLAYLRSTVWWILLGVVWVVALYGFASKVLFAYRVENVSMWPCIVLGGIPFVSIPTLLNLVSIGALWWMMIGVGCYTTGLVFWLNDRRVRHFHAIWHVLVIAGSACHFIGILMFVALAS
jgi:hemolysin III